MPMKPHKACDVDRTRPFPHQEMICMPKIDGVRLISMPDRDDVTSRELKPYRNLHLNSVLLSPEIRAIIKGCDGELAVRGLETKPECCRLTTSAVTKATGEPDLVWWLFDMIDDPDMIYLSRLHKIGAMIGQRKLPEWIKVVPHKRVRSWEEVDAAAAHWISLGFEEGYILRDPLGKHKNGRATVNEANYMRAKEFVDEECIVVSMNEMMWNENDPKLDELGYIDRSSAKDGLIAAGAVGSLNCKSERWGEFCVGAGEMTLEDKYMYWNSPELIVGHSITFKYFPQGIKDKPRFPTFKSVRAELE